MNILSRILICTILLISESTYSFSLNFYNTNTTLNFKVQLKAREAWLEGSTDSTIALQPPTQKAVDIPAPQEGQQHIIIPLESLSNTPTGAAREYDIFIIDPTSNNPIQVGTMLVGHKGVANPLMNIKVSPNVSIDTEWTGITNNATIPFENMNDISALKNEYSMATYYGEGTYQVQSIGQLYLDDGKKIQINLLIFYNHKEYPTIFTLNFFGNHIVSEPAVNAPCRTKDPSSGQIKIGTLKTGSAGLTCQVVTTPKSEPKTVTGTSKNSQGAKERTTGQRSKSRSSSKNKSSRRGSR